MNKKSLTFSIIILLISLSVYCNTLFNGFVMDDYPNVLKNKWIKDIKYIPEIFSSNFWELSGEKTSFYRPLVHIIYMINYIFFGLKPWSFHLVNILFHSGTSLLVFFITAQIFKGILLSQKGYLLFPPFISAIFFALHPIHTEAVAWVSGIMDISFAFFYLLSFLAYIKSKEGKNLRKSWFVLSLFTFFISSLCKEPALTLPFLLLAYDSIFEKERIWRLRSLKKYIAFLAVASVYFLMRVYAIKGFVPFKKDLAAGSYNYFFNTPVLFSMYIKKLLFPVRLNVWHVFSPFDLLITVIGPLFIALVLCFLLFALITISRNRIIIFGIFCIVVPLIPVFYVPALTQKLENVFTERYLYLPSVGFTLILAFWVYQILKNKPEWRQAVVIILCVLTVIYCVETIRRNMVWRDNYTLWTDAAEKSPESSNPHNALGDFFNEKGLIDRAIEEYETAIHLEPNSPHIHINLGTAYAKKGWKEKAREEFLLAIRLKPEYPEPYNNLGIIYANLNREDLAIKYFERAVKLNPLFEEAYKNMSIVYSKKGLTNEAIRYLNIALKLNPDDSDARNNLGTIYAENGLIDKAIENFAIAVKLNPGEISFRRNLIRAYYIKGLDDKAEEQKNELKKLIGK